MSAIGDVTKVGQDREKIGRNYFADENTPEEQRGQGPPGGWKTVNGKKIRSKQTRAERKAYRKKHLAAVKKRDTDRSRAFLEGQQKIWDNLTEVPEFKQCGLVCHHWHKNLEVNILGQIRFRDTKKPVVYRFISGGYITLSNMNITFPAHRAVLETFRPKQLSWLECDHVNGNPADNRLCNLRWVSRTLNQVYIPSIGYTKRQNKYWKSYQVKFRRVAYGTFRCTTEARAKFDSIRNAWIKAEKQRIVDAVIKKCDCTTKVAFQLLNWSGI